MKHSAFLFSCILSLSALSTSVVRADHPINRLVKRCVEDSLTAQEAVERVTWCFKCKLITKTERDFFLYNREGAISYRPRYPVFTENNFERIISMPTDSKQECPARSDLPKSYLTCRSDHKYE